MRSMLCGLHRLSLVYNCQVASIYGLTTIELRMETRASIGDIVPYPVGAQERPVGHPAGHSGNSAAYGWNAKR